MAFGLHRESFFRQWGCFFLCNFLLAGAILGIGSLTQKGFATWGNSCCYLDFSLVSADSIHCCGIFSAASLHPAPRQERHTDSRFQVFLRLGERRLMLNGLADTGNNLTDTFSGTPVIVCSATALEPLLAGTPVEQLRGYRLAPCTTVTAEGLVPLFRPDEVCIPQTSSTEKSRSVHAMVALPARSQVPFFTLCSWNERRFFL